MGPTQMLVGACWKCADLEPFENVYLFAAESQIAEGQNKMMVIIYSLAQEPYLL